MQLLHTGLAQTLQGQLVGTGTARLMRVGCLHGARGEVRMGGNLLGNVASVGLDGPLGHAAALGGPLRRLRDAVLAAEHVILELIEARC